MRPIPFERCTIVELRQYTLHPGRLADLVEVFEEHFIEGQESVGITVGGIYEDETAPNRFVWMRGFPDLDARSQALRDFYFGPVWAVHKEVANGTMVDSDDVLMLQPTVPPRPARRGARGNGERVLVGVHPQHAEPDHAALERVLETAVATWHSHPGPNGFPQLPVRDEVAHVWSATFPTEDSRTNGARRLSQESVRPDQLLFLRPTPRSQHPAGD